MLVRSFLNVMEGKFGMFTVIPANALTINTFEEMFVWMFLSVPEGKFWSTSVALAHKIIFGMGSYALIHLVWEDKPGQDQIAFAQLVLTSMEVCVLNASTDKSGIP